MSELISAYEFSDHLEEETGEHQHEAAWRRLVTCMNDLYQNHNPLIGREQELTRTHPGTLPTRQEQPFACGRTRCR